MSLFDDGITIQLEPDEFKDFSSVSVRGMSTSDSLAAVNVGGPQYLYLMLVGRMSPSGHITLEDQDALKVHRYAYAYGNGGYQRAFRAVVKALWRAGWVQTDKEQHKAQPEHKGRRWAGEP